MQISRAGQAGHSCRAGSSQSLSRTPVLLGFPGQTRETLKKLCSFRGWIISALTYCQMILIGKTFCSFYNIVETLNYFIYLNIKGNFSKGMFNYSIGFHDILRLYYFQCEVQQLTAGAENTMNLSDCHSRSSSPRPTGIFHAQGLSGQHLSFGVGSPICCPFCPR